MLKTDTIPADIIVANPNVFRAKVARFTATNLHAIFDFDRTLTVKKPGSDHEVTTWQILGSHLPDEVQPAYKALFEKYRGLELEGMLTQQDAVDWWSATLDLFVEHKVNLGAVEATFLERASVRPGTSELFELLKANDIPTIILSAGVREVIEIWCRQYGIEPTLIISTSLQLNDAKEISGWQRDTLVHVLNKSEATHPELSVIRSERPMALLVGDSLDDAAMANGDDTVLRVRILDPRADETISEEEMQRTFEKFDAAITTGTLHSLVELMKNQL